MSKDSWRSTFNAQLSTYAATSYSNRLQWQWCNHLRNNETDCHGEGMFRALFDKRQEKVLFVIRVPLFRLFPRSRRICHKTRERCVFFFAFTVFHCFRCHSESRTSIIHCFFSPSSSSARRRIPEADALHPLHTLVAFDNQQTREQSVRSIMW